MQNSIRAQAKVVSLSVVLMDDKKLSVIIEDDGVGFDVNEQKNDGRSHIGMENTKKRLQDMCGGEVIIKSKPGEGTVAKIIIPKKEENKA